MADPLNPNAKLPVIYKGEPTGVYFTPDFVCFGDVIVELKALKALGPIEEAQALNYVKLAKFRCALVLNFGAKSLEWQRFLL
jgi:GxxExxY protein